MFSNRISLRLAAFLLVVSAGMTARSQDHELQGLALFEPADERPYENWAQPKQGLFFTFDGLYWHISPPSTTPIGATNFNPTVYSVAGNGFVSAVPEYNSLDTSTESSIWKWGDRMELGYVDGHNGIMFTSLSTQSQTSDFTTTNASVVFNDPGVNGVFYLNTLIPVTPFNGAAFLGRTPVVFSSMYVQDKSRLDGVEALYIYRPSELPLGGTVEFTAGGRYFELKDQFWVDARGGNLTDSYWNTHSHNEIAGPEVGVRYYQPLGRFGFSAESRFTAGLNSQLVSQDGILASQLTGTNNLPPQPLAMSATSFNHSANWYEFSPIVELRVEAHAQLTNLIAVKAGYTGIFVNNVVRAADKVDYTLPTMGILPSGAGNLQSVFIQGLNLSIEFNR